MERLTHIISQTYAKYTPRMQRKKVEFNLDLRDHGAIIDQNATELTKLLDKLVAESIKRNPRSKILISSAPHSIAIHDDGNALTKQVCAELSNDILRYKSRVGFGTTVTINLQPTYQN